jgi:hypothetical protein
MLTPAHVQGLVLPPAIRLVVGVDVVLVPAVQADVVDCHHLISPASLNSLRLASLFPPLFFISISALKFYSQKLDTSWAHPYF